ncbi:hypothetical protein A4X06_0g7558 [Tilletia controversa]|uniref:MADS-box domain-containing protein n=1 Tax=Tilletia controversa TaxID=13291 RepID=A0A8X7MLP8_9BASI|nr:hypothetical protein CF328_g6580 [Tilletia controversa]KAE8241385.1 hypothetical protein A4X06_0g7558 [Tilletia controversa]
MPTPPLSSPDSLFSHKSSLSIDSVTSAGRSSFSSSNRSSVSKSITSPPARISDLKQTSARSTPSLPTSSTSPPPPPLSSQGAHLHPSSPLPPAAAAVVAAAAKRRRAQTEVQRLPLQLPLVPSGSMSGNLSSYGNAVTQLVPPRRLERRPSVIQPENDLAGAKGEADAVTGRRRIQIGYISNEARRASTFKKRKAGLLKKAYELAELTGSHVLVVAVNDLGKCYSFATPSLQPMVTHPEGQTLLKRCLANGQTGNDSTSFDTSQFSGEHSSFGAVESLLDEDDDDDDEDDSDGDADMADSIQLTPAKNRPTMKRAKATMASPSTSDRSLRRGTGPILKPKLGTTSGMEMSQSLSGNFVPLKPVFLSSANPPSSSGRHSQSSSVSWSPFIGSQSMGDYNSPQSPAPPHILAFDQAAAAHHHMLGMFTSTAGPAEPSVPAEAPLPPSLITGEPIASSLPAPTRSSFRGGRPRAATMLNPIEIQPLPSDSMATRAFLTGQDLPSPVNALALNLGSAYIGGGGGGGGDVSSGIGLSGMQGSDGMVPLGHAHGHGHSRTYDIQSSNVGRPRSHTTYPAHHQQQHTSLVSGQSMGVMPSSVWTTFDPSLLPGAFMPSISIPASGSGSGSERRTGTGAGSGTLGKRKLSMEVDQSNEDASLVPTSLGGGDAAPMLAPAVPTSIPLSSSPSLVVVPEPAVMMQQDDTSSTSTPRKMARTQGALSPGGGMSATMEAAPSSSPDSRNAAAVNPRAFGRVRSYTLGTPLQHLGLGSTAEVMEEDVEQQQQQNFGPAFCHTPGTGGPASLFSAPVAASSASAMMMASAVDPFAAAVAAGLDPFGAGNNNNNNHAGAAATAPRALMNTPFLDGSAAAGAGSPFSGGLMMGGVDSSGGAGPSSAGFFDTLNFGGGASAMLMAHHDAGDATMEMSTGTKAGLAIPPSVSRSTSNPMTANNSGQGAGAGAGAGAASSTDFLHRLQQQYKEHDDVQLHQHQELQRHYAELTAAAAAAAAGGMSGSGTPPQP